MKHHNNKAKKTEAERNTEEVGNLVSARIAVYSEIKRRFAARNILMIPQVDGLWGGVDLYTPRLMSVEGLSIQSKRLVRMEPAYDSEEVAAVFNEPFGDKLRNGIGTSWGINMVIESGSQTTGWYKFIAPRAENSGDGQISWSGSIPAKKVVPQREWFPPAVQKITAEQLLTLFDGPQRDAFLLHLGRILAGPKGERTIEGIMIQHFYRVLLAIKGPPGVGKTHLWDMLRGAIKECGYQSVPFDPKNEKFGMKEATLADASYCGDVAALDPILKLTDMKTFVTGGLHRLEEKFEKHVAVEMRAAFLFMLNDLHVSCNNMESGILDRLLLVETKPRHRLTKPSDAWPKLIEETRTNEKVLALWLWRLGFEQFMNSAGYGIDPVGWDHPKASRLEAEMHRIKSATVQVDLSHSRDLARALVQFAAASVALYYTPSKLLKVLKKGHLNLSMLVVFFLFLSNVQDYKLDPFKDAYKRLYPRHLEPDFTSLRGFLSRFGEKVSLVDPGTLFKELVTHLRTTQGFRYPAQWPKFREEYRSCLLLIEDDYKEFQELDRRLIPYDKGLGELPDLYRRCSEFASIVIAIKEPPTFN